MKILKDKIIKNNFTIGIVGLGYVGLPLAIRFIKKKIKVIGVDNDKNKINILKSGNSYISSVKKKDILYFKKNPSFLSNSYKLLREADVIIICLPTPLNKFNKPDMSYLYNSMNLLRSVLKKKQVLIIESTVYPGATNDLIKFLKLKLKPGEDYFVCYSPERENPGDKKFTYMKTPKIISGLTNNCSRIGFLIYKKIVKKVIVTKSIEIAEMSKLLENIYRSVNIAMINEIKLICDRFKINVHEVIEAASTKNFGFVKFNPGPGVGGHCIPIDPYYLSWAAKRKGYNSKFIKASGTINKFLPKWIFNKIIKFFAKNKLKLNKILIVGVSYKKNIDDDRESPAYEIMKYLSSKKIKFDYHDPYFERLRIGRKNKFDLQNIDLTKKNLSKYSCVLIVTDHDNINYNKLLKNSKYIFDCRGRMIKYKEFSQKNKIIYC